MPKYYQKELPESPIFVRGAPLRFDIMATEDPVLIGELTNCVNGHFGGIIEITEEQYAEELKKKESRKASNASSNSQQWRQELSALHQPQRNAAVAGSFARPQQPLPDQMSPSPRVPMPDPLTVPTPADFVFKPPTAKVNKAPS